MRRLPEVDGGPPRRHRSRHRVPKNHDRTYAVVVVAATAGAGITSFAVSAMIPSQAHTTTLAANVGDTTAAIAEPQDVSADRSRALTATQQRSSRSQRRMGAPTPVQISQWVSPA